MKIFMLFLGLLAIVSLPKERKMTTSLSHDKLISPCIRNCATKGQDLFDRLFIDKNWNYKRAHNFAQSWMKDCYEDCQTPNSKQQPATPTDQY